MTTRFKLRAFFAIAAAFVGLVWWTLENEHAAIDSCLDGGGRWDHGASVCDP